MILDKLEFEPLTAVNRFGVYCIPEQFKDREVSRLLLAAKVNEPRTLELIRNYARQHDVISGGAFVGDFLPAISTALAEGAVLHSFEPNPPSFQAAQATIALNRLTNVHLHPTAVGAKADTLPLQVARPNGAELGGMSTIVESPTAGRTIDVPVVPLDDLVDPDRSVSVLHLDVEGYEWQALEGAARVISQNAPLLVLEATTSRPSAEDEAWLNERHPDLGYRLMGRMERNAIYVPTQA
ncbi:MAG: FkbM family methyltransferase [Paracoccaceae bacterium]